MPKIRYLKKSPDNKLFYLVDACFLVNKFIPHNKVSDVKEKDAIMKSREWWIIIEQQIEAGKAIVYVLNVCIAEAFKALFKQYIKGGIDYQTYDKAREGLQKDLILTPAQAKNKKGILSFMI